MAESVHNPLHKMYPIFISCGAMVVLFVGLLIYHCLRQMKDTQIEIYMRMLCSKLFSAKAVNSTSHDSSMASYPESEDREPLLASYHDQ